MARPTPDSPAKDKLRCGALAVIVVIVVVGARARAAGFAPPVVYTPAMASAFDSVLGIGSVIVVAAGLMLLGSFRRTLKVTVAPTALPVSGPRPSGKWLNRRVVIGVLAGVLLVSVWVILSHPNQSRTLLPPAMGHLGLGTAQGGMRSAAPQPSSGGPVKTVLLILVLSTAGGMITVLLRRNRSAQPPEELSQEQAMARAVEAGRQAVLDRAADNPREAIVACFVAMEHALAGRGDALAPQISDTPSEVLERGIQRASLPAAASRSLLRLFREAQFSAHPMTERDRMDADECLGELLDALETSGRVHGRNPR